jgi:signal transduction histidine kinase
VTIRSCRIDQRPQWLRLSEADNGPGIQPAVIGRIFDLLYTTKTEGTGLRPWLSRRIIQEHNGKIEVASEPGGVTASL